ncbi:MAG: hypothetical protein GDA48_27000 [Hormoscilla sp. GM102CHS1]|nr:hypothetical protein [Hormoscilla sp. GM102CHS1]
MDNISGFDWVGGLLVGITLLHSFWQWVLVQVGTVPEKSGQEDKLVLLSPLP